MFKLFFIVAILISNTVFAGKTEIIDNLSQFVGPINQQNIINTPLKGVYEVIIDEPISSVLVSEDGKYIIQGTVIDLTTRKLMPRSNIVKKLKLKLINTIDDTDKIIYKSTNEKHIVHVFTDVDCLFCRRLHADIEQINKLGITIKYLASPLVSLHPKALEKMEKIWCADNRNKAIDSAKKNQQIINTKPCKNPVSEQLSLARRLGVNSTPAIFLEDGTHIHGYITPQELLKKVTTRLEK